MGEWRKARTFKFSEEESAMLLRIHDALAPMHETESQTLRWTLRVMYVLIFTEGSLQVLLMAMQARQGKTVYDNAEQLSLQLAGARAYERPRIRVAALQTNTRGGR